MKILLVNGSPKGERSNTLHITKAFLEGLTASGEHEVTTFMVKDKHIEFCTGCFRCWSRKDGKCIFHDDMQEYTELYKAADVVIFNTPVYYFGMPARLKNLLDRTLPFHVPEIVERAGESGGQRHEYRFDVGGKKIILIATCGFYSYENNVEPLVKLFDICFGDMGYEKILCPEGTLFSLQIFHKVTNPYLDSARKAGVEVARDGHISEETKKELVRRTFGVSDYLLLANNYWIQTDESTSEHEKKIMTVRQRVRQMPALFTDIPFGEDPTVIEMDFPKLDYTCQLQLAKEDMAMKENPDDFLPFHLKLILDSDRFIAIASEHTRENTPGRVGGSFDPRRLGDIALRVHKAGISKEMKF